MVYAGWVRYQDQVYPGEPGEILIPRKTSSDRAAFDGTARKLAQLFAEKFTNYAAAAGDEIITGPKVAAAATA